MKRSMLLAVTAVALLLTGVALRRCLVPEPERAAESTGARPLPSAYRHNKQYRGSSFHQCLRGRS